MCRFLVALPAAALRLLAPVWACGCRLCVWARSPPPCRVSARPYIYSRLCGCVSLLASPPAPAPLAAQTHGRGLNSPPAVSGAGGSALRAHVRKIYILSQLVRNLGHAWYTPCGVACLCYTASLFPLRNMPLHDITPSRVNKRSAPLTWRDVPCVTYYERSVHNEANQ